jgi:parallel beta-helix repeat protein
MKHRSLFLELPVLLLLACCFLLLGGAASAQLQGSLDSKNADTFASWTNPTLSIGGWAAAVEDGKPATSVRILIDGNVIGSVAPSTARPDVAAYLGSNAYPNTGWSFSFNAGSLQPGSHTLLALAIDAEGASAPLAFYQCSSSVNVPAPQPPQGSLDALSATTVAQSDTIVVNGWAGDPQDGSPVKQVQILLDGTSVGNATLGSSRPDVVAVYPKYVNAGWTFSYRPSALYGQHTFIAVAYDKEGLSFPLSLVGQNTFTVLAPDLIESAPSVLTGTVISGGTIQLSDTTTNQGNGNAIYSTTRYYVNTSATKGGTAIGTRTVNALAAGASSPSGTLTFTMPSNLLGQYYVLACANDGGNVVESNTTNNCTASVALSVAGADLSETAVAVLGGGTNSGGTIQVSDTVTNQGTGNAIYSTTRYYLSTSTNKGGTAIGTRTVNALAPGASSPSGTLTFAMPSNLLGQYYVVACANDGGNVVESNTANNCSASAAISVAGADLAETAVAVVGGSMISGGTIQVSDTVTNQGAGNAIYSTTRYYLSTSTNKGGTALGTRTVNALASGAGSSSGTLTFTMPSNVNGQYYVVACANDAGNVVEINTANNCLASAALLVTGADLIVTAVGTNPAAVLPGATLAITDTTSNALANSAISYTRYYLSDSTNLVKTGSGAAVVLGTRTVPALAMSTASTATVNTTVPASTIAGNYFVFACANDTNVVVESNVNNNCTPTPVVVYAAANTVFVDQANANAKDTSCGLSATPCKTIAEGLSAAKTGQTVLVNPGSYAEQITITQNVTLASITKNTAVIRAPAVLVPDPELYATTTSTGQQTVLVNITGGATNVSVVNMGVRGPGPSSCGSIGYGIYIANANASILGNQVLSIRDEPYSGCQNGLGIRFGSRGFGFIGHSGIIAYNTINDYNKGGIVVDGDGTSVNVMGNVVIGQKTAAINGQNGIQISRGAYGLVDSNTVLNNRYADTPLSMSADGILIYDIANGVTVTNNTVTGNDEGIGVYSDVPTASLVVIKNNTVNNNPVVGIHTDASSSGNTIWTNTAQGNGVYDAADEHPTGDTSNDWGQGVLTHNNVLGSAIRFGSF